MEIKSHLIRIQKPNPEAHRAQKPRRHAGNKAPKGASEETGGIEKRMKKWLPKRDTLTNSNV